MLAKLGFLLSKGQEISAGKDFWRVLVRCDRSALQLPVFHKPEIQKVDHSIANGMDRFMKVTRQGNAVELRGSPEGVMLHLRLDYWCITEVANEFIIMLQPVAAL